MVGIGSISGARGSISTCSQDWRIREDVLERDYCLAWFLDALAESDLRPVLVFKGGTALKRCYFADYRFSEGVDFTLRQALPFEEIRTRLEPVYAAVAQQSGCISMMATYSAQACWNLRSELTRIEQFSRTRRATDLTRYWGLSEGA